MERKKRDILPTFKDLKVDYIGYPYVVRRNNTLLLMLLNGISEHGVAFFSV